MTKEANVSTTNTELRIEKDIWKLQNIGENENHLKPGSRTGETVGDLQNIRVVVNNNT